MSWFSLLQRRIPAALAMLALAGSSIAQTTVLSGRLDDPLNAALVGSDLGAPSFVDASAIANNVALYTLNVLQDGNVTIHSTGFAAGGIDPYVTLFSGPGTSGTFLASNYASAFSTGGDFSLDVGLLAGSYRLAVGTFANMSSSENAGTGTLADGFTALGAAAYLGNGSYQLEITTPVPEPSTWALAAIGLAMLVRCRRRSSYST